MRLGGYAIALSASSSPDALLKSRFSSCSSAASPVQIPVEERWEKSGVPRGI